MIIIGKYRVLYLYYNELKISKITKHIYYAINSAHRVIFSAFLQKKRWKFLSTIYTMTMAKNFSEKYCIRT